MPEILSEHKSAFNRILDGMSIAGLKMASEYGLGYVVGNGNYISAATKLGAGLASSAFIKNKFGDYLSVAFMVDGGEDLVQAILGQFSNKGSASTATVSSGIRIV